MLPSIGGGRSKHNDHAGASDDAQYEIGGGVLPQQMGGGMQMAQESHLQDEGGSSMLPPIGGFGAIQHGQVCGQWRRAWGGSSPIGMCRCWLACAHLFCPLPPC